jgi:hypothetical protein
MSTPGGGEGYPAKRRDTNKNKRQIPVLKLKSSQIVCDAGVTSNNFSAISSLWVVRLSLGTIYIAQPVIDGV